MKNAQNAVAIQKETDIKKEPNKKQKKIIAAKLLRQKRREEKQSFKQKKRKRIGKASKPKNKKESVDHDKAIEDKAIEDKVKGENANEENAKRENAKNNIAQKQEKIPESIPEHDFKNGKMEKLEPTSVLDHDPFNSDENSGSSEFGEETNHTEEQHDLNNQKVLGTRMLPGSHQMGGNGKTGQETLDHSNPLTNLKERPKQDQLKLVLHQPHLNELEVKNMQIANEHQSHIHGHPCINKANELISHGNKDNFSGDLVSDAKKVIVNF
jgi:hypothetical protein